MITVCSWPTTARNHRLVAVPVSLSLSRNSSLCAEFHGKYYGMKQETWTLYPLPPGIASVKGERSQVHMQMQAITHSSGCRQARCLGRS